MNARQPPDVGLGERFLYFILDLIFAGVWAAVGALLGWIFLPGLWATLHSLVGWGPKALSELSCAILGAVVGAIIAFCKTVAKDRRQHRTREVAADLGLRYSSDADALLEDHLREMFNVAGFVDLENVIYEDAESARFLVGDLKWSEHRATSSPSASAARTVAQTIAFFESDTVGFPEFVLQPANWLLNVFSPVAGIQRIVYEEEPEFERTYHLAGVRPGHTRRLFDGRLLEFFSRNPGWEARGQGKRLVLCRSGRQCDRDDLPEFIERVLEVFELFREAASKLTAHPPDTKPDGHIAQKPPPRGMRTGATGREVTYTELNAFLDESPPRMVPASIRRQRIASGSLAAVLIGAFFSTVGGIFIITSEFIAEGSGNGDSVFATAIGFVLTSVGILLMYPALRYRRVNIRLLRAGIVTKGTIEDVRRTELVVNQERRYHVSIHFKVDGSERIEKCSVYGKAVGDARRFAERQMRVRVLYDQRDPRRILWAESLITASPEDE